MNQPNFEKWNEITKKIQEPFKAIAELNVKTLQGLAYLKPEDLIKIKNPEEFIEKQMNLALENGQKALDYMQKSFQIFETTLHTVAKESQEEVK